MTVPIILEDLWQAPDGDGIRALRPLDFVACGGGPMKTSVAEALSAGGVLLLNHCGATEIGALAPIFNPGLDYDWRYFVVRKDLDLRFENVVEKPGCVKLLGRPPGWDEDFVVQDFLRPNPKAPTSQFQFIGRADDLIVLANGEKVRPTNLEAMVSEDPHVQDCIAFGEGHDYLGLIVEAAPDLSLDCSDGAQVDAFVEDVWPVVQTGNEEVDSHGEVTKNMILAASSSSKPLNRTAKGSLAKKEIYQAFEAEINKAYESTETIRVEPLPDLGDVVKISEYLRETIRDILNLTPETDTLDDGDDFFEFGMNSLQATRLQYRLVASSGNREDEHSSVPVISRNFAYSHPTISSMQKALTSNAWDNERNGVLSIDPETRRTAAMLDTVERYCHPFATMEGRASSSGLTTVSDPENKIVVITGSTGNLGSNILYTLAIDPKVSLIYCLNRKSATDSDPMNRQDKAFRKAGICFPIYAWSKIQLVEVELQKPDFGLESKTYHSLKQASYIIHNAWPMDFNRSLLSFESQFQYLCNIIQLGLQHRGIEAPRLLFTSSIAAIARYVPNDGNILVPETRMESPAVTAPFGYPEAKWVCEQILHRAGATHEARLEPMIVRVGQLTGSTSSGTWAPTEHLPSLFKSSQTLNALPEIPGVSHSFYILRTSRLQRLTIRKDLILAPHRRRRVNSHGYPFPAQPSHLISLSPRESYPPILVFPSHNSLSPPPPSCCREWRNVR